MGRLGRDKQMRALAALARGYRALAAPPEADRNWPLHRFTLPPLPHWPGFLPDALLYVDPEILPAIGDTVLAEDGEGLFCEKLAALTAEGGQLAYLFGPSQTYRKPYRKVREAQIRVRGVVTHIETPSREAGPTPPPPPAGLNRGEADGEV